MLKSLFAAVALVIFSSATVQARSLHPCTPTVEAVPSRMSCPSGKLHFSIVINTWMSPSYEMCQGANHIETHQANVEVINKRGQVVARFTLSHDEFNYRLGASGNGTFNSDEFGLHLDQCVSPLHGGGISVGN